MRKLFLDDLREPPDDSFVLARNPTEFVKLLNSNNEGFDEICFDHDLGITGHYDNTLDIERPEFIKDGHDCLKYLIEKCELEKYPQPSRIVIHTTNPDERRMMKMTAEKYFSNCQVSMVDGLMMKLRPEVMAEIEKELLDDSYRIE